MKQVVAVLVFLILTECCLSEKLETKGHLDVKYEDRQVHLEQPMLRRLVYLVNSKKFTAVSSPGRGSPAAIDLMIALGSSAVQQGRHQFELQKKTASLVASEFSISPSGTRVSLVSLFGRPRRLFDFSTFLNKECSIRAINNARPARGLYSSCDLEKVFSRITRGWRKKALKILLVFVNKYQILSSKIHDLVERYLGDVEVFVMAIGPRVGLDSPLIRLASKPRPSHFVTASSYYKMMKKISAIKYKGVNKRCNPKRQFTYDECGRRCVCKDGVSRHCYRIRKEFTTMTFEERVRFVQTIKQANLDPKYREEFSRLTNIHTEQFFRGVHKVNFFLPWHRWYLYEFENFLRRFDCRVTIPYWDWARVAETIWRENHARDVWNPGPHGLGGNGRREEDGCVMDGPFREGQWYQSKESGSGCLKRKFQYNRQPRDTTAIRKTIASSFSVFEYNVRKVFHNELHCLIGGTMGGNYSSQSPEFWLHHAFLDKIWVQYQERGDKERDEYYPQVKDTLPGCQSNWRPGDFVNETNLPGCVGILYEEVEDQQDLEDRTEARIKHHYGETFRYKDLVCYKQDRED